MAAIDHPTLRDKRRPPRSQDGNLLIIDYLYLRKTVGWIGTLLPIVLVFGNWILYVHSSTSVQESMSHYYYTRMRDVFVGAQCALGVFLVAYAGYDELDRWITNIAGFCAIGVAFFPTKPTVCAPHAPTCQSPAVRTLSTYQDVGGSVHLFFAATTFVLLGVMALRFAKSALTEPGPMRLERIKHELGFDGGSLSPRKKLGNKIYRMCGAGIIASIVLAALSNALPMSVKNSFPFLLLFEALAVFLFGIAWFVKGETLSGVFPGLKR